MSSSHYFTIMSLEQVQKYCHKVIIKYLTYFPISQIVSEKGSRSPFQKQFTILQNTINNCDTLRDNFPQGFAETLL